MLSNYIFNKKKKQMYKRMKRETVPQDKVWEDIHRLRHGFHLWAAEQEKI